MILLSELVCVILPSELSKIMSQGKSSIFIYPVIIVQENIKTNHLCYYYIFFRGTSTNWMINLMFPWRKIIIIICFFQGKLNEGKVQNYHTCCYYFVLQRNALLLHVRENIEILPANLLLFLFRGISKIFKEKNEIIILKCTKSNTGILNWDIIKGNNRKQTYSRPPE